MLTLVSGELTIKALALTVTALLCLAVLTVTATSQSQTGDSAYEKKSYNYAEWAKGRFADPTCP